MSCKTVFVPTGNKCRLIVALTCTNKIESCVFALTITPSYPRRFYLGKHSGRQLSLQPQLGSADLNATFYGTARRDEPSLDESSSATSNISLNTSKSGPRKHIIQVSSCHNFSGMNDKVH